MTFISLSSRLKRYDTTVTREKKFTGVEFCSPHSPTCPRKVKASPRQNPKRSEMQKSVTYPTPRLQNPRDPLEERQDDRIIGRNEHLSSVSESRESSCLINDGDDSKTALLPSIQRKMPSGYHGRMSHLKGSWSKRTLFLNEETLALQEAVLSE